LTRTHSSEAKLQAQVERGKDNALRLHQTAMRFSEHRDDAGDGNQFRSTLLSICSVFDSADLTQGDCFMKLSIALLAALLSTAAFAQQEPQRSSAPNYTQPPAAEAAPHASSSVDVSSVFDKLNTTHDGKLTRQQAQVHPTVAANFDSVDTNHDGVISKDEFLAAFKPQP
jgi:hypothetical protein